MCGGLFWFLHFSQHLLGCEFLCLSVLFKTVLSLSLILFLILMLNYRFHFLIYTVSVLEKTFLMLTKATWWLKYSKISYNCDKL